MTNSALNGLRIRKTELEARQAAFMMWMGSPSMVALKRLERLMNCWIKPRADDVRDQTWLPSARERLTVLAEAKASRDIGVALANGRLVRPEPGSEIDRSTQMFFAAIDGTRELAGLTEVLAWLEEFEACVATGDAVRVMHQLAQLGVSPHARCDCTASEIEGADSSPVLAWLHAHHAEYNRVVWEIISSKAGLIEALRQAIQDDISSPGKRIVRHLYGEAISRPYARELIKGFVRPQPTAKWVGQAVAA